MSIAVREPSPGSLPAIRGGRYHARGRHLLFRVERGPKDPHRHVPAAIARARSQYAGPGRLFTSGGFLRERGKAPTTRSASRPHFREGTRFITSRGSTRMGTGHGIVDDQQARRKRAELAGGMGAGALGMGLGVVLAGYTRGAGLLLVVAGAALHATGMWDKHRLER